MMTLNDNYINKQKNSKHCLGVSLKPNDCDDISVNQLNLLKSLMVYSLRFFGIPGLVSVLLYSKSRIYKTNPRISPLGCLGSFHLNFTQVSPVSSASNSDGGEGTVNPF